MTAMKRNGKRFETRVRAELFKNVLDVIANRRRADAETIGHRLGVRTCGKQS